MMTGPVRSSYTPAAARVEAMITRAERLTNVPSSAVIPRPGARLAAFLAHHLDALDAGGGVDGLDHVVERQSGHADRRQRLHLDPGSIGGAHGSGDADVRRTHLELDVDTGECQLVAQRDQVAGPLRGQD